MPNGRKIEIYRAAQASRMTSDDGNFEKAPTPAEDGMTRLFDAGLAEGNVTKRLFDVDGFSLLYVWFKPGFPLPRHSHDQDCLYYVVSGSVKFGTEDLAAGDGFFVPADAPYTYVVGDDGVEILEFRHKGDFSSKTFGSDSYWEKAVQQVRDCQTAWSAISPPRPAA